MHTMLKAKTKKSDTLFSCQCIESIFILPLKPKTLTQWLLAESLIALKQYVAGVISQLGERCGQGPLISLNNGYRWQACKSPGNIG